MNEHADIFLFAAGTFTVFAAAMNASFFFNHRKAQFMVRILGHAGARIFYIAMGLLLIAAGALVP